MVDTRRFSSSCFIPFQELILLGFISLMRTVLQGAISKLCILEKYVKNMLPCSFKENETPVMTEHRGKFWRLLSEVVVSQSVCCASKSTMDRQDWSQKKMSFEKSAAEKDIATLDYAGSKWMGYFLLRKSMFNFVICAWDRWLKPIGVMTKKEEIEMEEIRDS